MQLPRLPLAQLLSEHGLAEGGYSLVIQEESREEKEQLVLHLTGHRERRW